MSQADEVLPDCCQVKLRCKSNLLTLVSIVPSTIKSKAIEYTIVQAKFYLLASCHFHPNTRILHTASILCQIQDEKLVIDGIQYSGATVAF